jgi:hypothetical protein
VEMDLSFDVDIYFTVVGWFLQQVIDTDQYRHYVK